MGLDKKDRLPGGGGEIAALAPAVLAHELRTPLNVVQGYAGLIAEAAYGPVGDERYLAAARQMVDACRHMAELIDGVLDIGRMDAGADVLHEEILDIHHLVDSALQWLRQRIVASGVVVRSRVPLMPVLVRGDARRLRQAVLNLLDNAIKYTPRGGHIDVVLRDAADGGLWVEVDNDAPPPEPDAGEKPFVRGEAAEAKTFGAGLGLFITRCQMRAHGGDLEIRKNPRGNTVACLLLPPERRVRGE